MANYFLAKYRLTQVKLHKLLYYAHGWHLGFQEKPLLDETLEAWRYGPVVPSIHREFGRFGATPIDCSAMEFDPQHEDFLSVPRIDASDKFVRDLLARILGGLRRLHSRAAVGPDPRGRLALDRDAEEQPWGEVRRHPQRRDQVALQGADRPRAGCSVI